MRSQEPRQPLPRVRSENSNRRGVELLCPYRMVRSVTEITPQELVALGIKGVILDLDNTLVLWHQEEIASHTLAWLKSLQEAGLKLCVLSNSVLSKRSERVAMRLGCPNIRQAKKPSKGGFRRALQAMETDPHHTAMVGDQMFTDILGGNRMGLYTFMVEPMHPHEFAYTKYISRPPERLLLRYFRKRGHL
ncbi:MAG: YqeG family HAD IIIA-type phosphatase [Armatimonadetes bacterium]|nr:YqeG family HAD IIIA-type phosphatase [Armatimonadota bacterium]